MSTDDDEKRTPTTLPAPPDIPREFRVKTPKPPAGTRKLSGAMVFRFEEALKKLGEPGKRIDAERARVRELCGTDEQKKVFPKPITLLDPIEVNGEVAEKKE